MQLHHQTPTSKSRVLSGISLEGWRDGSSARTCVSSSSNFDPYSRSVSLLGGQKINDFMVTQVIVDSTSPGTSW